MTRLLGEQYFFLNSIVGLLITLSSRRWTPATTSSRRIVGMHTSVAIHDVGTAQFYVASQLTLHVAHLRFQLSDAFSYMANLRAQCVLFIFRGQSREFFVAHFSFSRAQFHARMFNYFFFPIIFGSTDR